MSAGQIALNEAARALNRAEELLVSAHDETRKGGNIALVEPKVRIAEGWIRLAEVKQQRGLA